MKVPRRTVLRGAATASTVAVAGCSSFQRDEQILLVQNETDTARDVTIVVRRAPEGGEDATTTTVGNATATVGTSPRFVVDFQYEVGANGRKENLQVLPKEGTYIVVADVPGVGTGRGTYQDTESVRVTISDDDVSVDTYRPE